MPCTRVDHDVDSIGVIIKSPSRAESVVNEIFRDAWAATVQIMSRNLKLVSGLGIHLHTPSLHYKAASAAPLLGKGVTQTMCGY